MSASARAVQRPVGRGWVHGMLCDAPRAETAALLLPPFFHEWQRSYRLFALLADALATRGVRVLRFDYRGSGESSGDDAEFLPSRALDDAEAMLAVLREYEPTRITLVGVRAGALLAEMLAERHRLPWCAWQGVDSGLEHLAELRERDTIERNSRRRFPFLRRDRAPESGMLMGHRVHEEFALELGIFKRRGEPAVRVDVPSRCGPADLALPDPLSDWVGQIDLQGSVPLAAIAAVATALAERLRAPAREGA
ncbi:alpha/beta fold hydrolase [Silanimonas sp.]|uniref:alpha/beta fold hydrolase n=1 Tax=Silanimonas sp. TaxID=1929290 RepID=UPI0022C07C35|nr:alpha/beta fold hydrolase [Silanimonas sp.]MCZ8165009.1 alpha/beta hydrolase [Silanimonas sp.]